MTAGVLLVSGCSRPPVKPRPVAVYVSAEALARQHPQWANVEALDRQIAWLQSYSPRSARPAALSAPPSVGVSRGGAPVDTTNLLQTIDSRLESVRRALEATDLRRLGQLHRRGLQDLDASLTQVRADAEQQAEAERQAIATKYDDSIAKILAQAEAIDSRRRAGLPTTSQERAKEWDEILAARSSNLRESARAQEAAWNGEIRMLGASVDRQVDEFRRAGLAQLESQREVDRAQMEARLNRSIQEQRSVFYTTLAQMSMAPLEANGERAAPPLPAIAWRNGTPSPNLSQAVAALRERRSVQAAFVLQNTRSLILSAAARRNEAPEFDRSEPGLPERTDTYLNVVRTGGRSTVAATS